MICILQDILSLKFRGTFKLPLQAGPQTSLSYSSRCCDWKESAGGRKHCLKLAVPNVLHLVISANCHHKGRQMSTARTQLLIGLITPAMLRNLHEMFDAEDKGTCQSHYSSDSQGKTRNVQSWAGPGSFILHDDRASGLLRLTYSVRALSWGQ